MRDLTDVDPELASLVRERLDTRVPRLPARFVPPPERPVRRRWVVAIAVAAFLLGVGAAMLIRPAVGTTVLSGVLGLQRPAATPTPAIPAGAPTRGSAPGAGPAGRAQPSPTGSPGPSPTPEAAPTTSGSGSAGGGTSGVPAPGATPAAQQSAPITIQVSLPPVLPTPTPKPSPTICVLGVVCVKT